MKYLCIGPAGMGFFAYLGLLKSIETKLNLVEEYSGSSAGSLLCLFLACGKNINEILEFSLKLDVQSLTKISLNGFINNYGFIEIEPIKKLLIEFIGGDKKFKDIEKPLYISSFCVNRNHTEYFSKYTHPDMSVIDAVCMSISIPFIFSCTHYNDMLYIDGGTVEDLPITPFYKYNPDEILAVKLKTSEINGEINNIKEYGFTLLKSFMRLRKHNDTKNIVNVNIDKYNIFNFKMSEDEKIEMYMIGIHTPIPFF